MRLVVPTEKIEAIEKDPADNKILECAVAASADFVVTGDTHLLKLGTCRGIKIITANDAVKKIRE